MMALPLHYNLGNKYFIETKTANEEHGNLFCDDIIVITMVWMHRDGKQER